MSIDTSLWKVLKKFDLFRVLDNEVMEKFSMKGRNKNKHKFWVSKISEAL